MRKTILITGSTDGIGLEAARMLVSKGHRVLLHGRDASKLERVRSELARSGGSKIGGHVADLARMDDVRALPRGVAVDAPGLDVLINNAGVLGVSEPTDANGLDLRFVVNAIAPYLLTRLLLPRMGPAGRVINLSSAAQASVDPDALAGRARLGQMAAYAQSKLALTMWSRSMAAAQGEAGPAIIAVNPGSMLGSKMVRESFGVEGNDLGIGARILTNAALGDDFAHASGRYYDNDSGAFADPHPDALDAEKCDVVVGAIEDILARIDR